VPDDGVTTTPSGKDGGEDDSKGGKDGGKEDKDGGKDTDQDGGKDKKKGKNKAGKKDEGGVTEASKADAAKDSGNDDGTTTAIVIIVVVAVLLIIVGIVGTVVYVQKMNKNVQTPVSFENPAYATGQPLPAGAGGPPSGEVVYNSSGNPGYAAASVNDSTYATVPQGQAGQDPAMSTTGYMDVGSNVGQSTEETGYMDIAPTPTQFDNEVVEEDV